MKPDRRKVQWAVYLILLIGLVIYGLRDSEGAEKAYPGNYRRICYFIQ